MKSGLFRIVGAGPTRRHRRGCETVHPGVDMTSTCTEIFEAQVLENACMRLAPHIRAYIFYLGLSYLRSFKSWGYPGEYLLDILNTGLSGVLGIERYLQIISRALRARTLQATAFQAVSRAWPSASAQILGY